MLQTGGSIQRSGALRASLSHYPTTLKRPWFIMSTSSNFDLTQTLFLFNWVSNSSCLESAPSQSLADLVYAVLTGKNNPFPTNLNVPGLLPTVGSSLLGGDWQLQWGPGVYELPGSNGKADNTAFVVYSKSQDAYVVAIAGTDPRAFWDWMSEDFQVGPNDCVNWTTFDPTGARPTGGTADASQAQISLGTALGVWALASQLALSQYAPATGYATLASYLKSLTPGSSATRLIFTGHSLGGALSPTLANWAKTNVKFSSSQIFAMPTAGPTPGNAAYQQAWDKTFPSTAVSVNAGNSVNALNCDIWSAQDVVPHAWQYIFSGNVNPAGLPPTQQYYFYGPLLDQTKLVSLIGNLVPGTDIRLTASGRQKVADAAGMTRSSHTIPFNTAFPLNYYKDGEVMSFPQPTGPYSLINGNYGSFFEALGLIHVWGYGVSAFGFDFSVFTQFIPTPVNPSS